MALARNLALLLMAVATPALAQTSAKPPAATAKPAVATAPAAPIANSPGATPAGDAWPKGAPQTDYEFTAWCYGVLRTHMELYERVKPELLAISKRWKTEEEDAKSYSDQIAAGKVLLADFARAVEMAEKASPRPINAQGAAAIEQGRKMWSQFDTVDKSNQAYSWMNWELPEKCPKVAKALENRALLASPALKANVSSTTPKPAETKKPEVASAPPKAVAELAKPPEARPVAAVAAKPAETKPGSPAATTEPASPVKLRPGRF